MAALTQATSLKENMAEFFYLVMRDGLPEVMEKMQWVLLEQGIELEHNILGCSYCQVQDGRFVYCEHSVRHPCHVFHDLFVEDHSVCGCEH